MSYNMTFRRPAVQPRSRVLREDIAAAPMLPPVEALPPLDPMMSETVTAVEAVQPMTKRYRATVTRTVTETALVEFDAPETADLYTMANELLPQIPTDAWVESPADSFGYIDRIEAVDVAPADPLDPSATLSDDMTPVDELDPLAPAGTASRRRFRFRRGVRLAGYRRNLRRARGRQVRMTADEVSAVVADVLARAEELIAVTPLTAADATAQVEQLITLDAELSALDGSTFDGTAPDAETAAYEMLASAHDAIVEMRTIAEETEAALIAAEGTAPDALLSDDEEQPVADPLFPAY